MKLRLPVVAGAGVALLALSGCGHLEDTFPYNSGLVIDRREHLEWCPGDVGWPDCVEQELQLQTVTAHGTYKGWQPVSYQLLVNCPVGSHWHINDPNTCD